jgi:hypothetical protein
LNEAKINSALSLKVHTGFFNIPGGDELNSQKKEDVLLRHPPIMKISGMKNKEAIFR